MDSLLAQLLIICVIQTFVGFGLGWLIARWLKKSGK